MQSKILSSDTDTTDMVYCEDEETARCVACNAIIYVVCLITPTYGALPEYCPSCGRKIGKWLYHVNG